MLKQICALCIKATLDMNFGKKMAQTLQNPALSQTYPLEDILDDRLEIEKLKSLGLTTRCKMIRKILSARTTNPIPSAIAASALTKIFNSFEISEEFYDWQREKRHLFVTALMDKNNRLILESYRNWNKISPTIQKQAIKKATRIHRDIYVDGVCQPLPYSVNFEERAIRRTGLNLSIVFGRFNGNIETGEGTITQYMEHGHLLHNAREAFDTTHHETTHLIQHHLSVAFQRGGIKSSHPLRREAACFHEIDRHHVYVSSKETVTYLSQPHEVLAHQEGHKISLAIEALAL